MELTLHKPGEHHFVRSFSAEGITITDTLYTRSLVVSAEALIENWPVRSFDELDAGLLQAVFDLEPEVVILGTGSRQLMLPPPLLMQFYERGVGVEAMTTEAACRTFNVLMSENRNAAAALIIDG
jgi:uncharacterized protein